MINTSLLSRIVKYAHFAMVLMKNDTLQTAIVANVFFPLNTTDYGRSATKRQHETTRQQKINSIEAIKSVIQPFYFVLLYVYVCMCVYELYKSSKQQKLNWKQCGQEMAKNQNDQQKTHTATATVFYLLFISVCGFVDLSLDTAQSFFKIKWCTEMRDREKEKMKKK